MADVLTSSDVKAKTLYISQMSRELVQLAQQADLSSLAYLLEMAREEAASLHARLELQED